MPPSPGHTYTMVGCPRHQKHVPHFSGEAGRWAPWRHRWAETPRPVHGRDRELGQRRAVALHAELAILGDVQLDRGSLGIPDPKGRDWARVPGGRAGPEPLVGGALALAQVPGPKAGAERHQSCWHSILPALGPVPGGGGQRPQYGLRPEGEQRTARAGSLQRRRPRGRQPLPRFLCLWHCPGVRIYSHFSQE